MVHQNKLRVQADFISGKDIESNGTKSILFKYLRERLSVARNAVEWTYELYPKKWGCAAAMAPLPRGIQQLLRSPLRPVQAPTRVQVDL